MKIITTTSAILLVGILFAGCATISEANLYWGDYSQTLYELKKNPSEATKKAHIAELEDIIQTSTDRGLRVPPGIYAELAVYSLEQGDKNKAQSLFTLEQQTYPESGVLIKQAMSK